MICDQGFEHPDPEPEVVVNEAPDVEPVADAQVRIAQIEADAAIQLAKIEAKVTDDELAVELAALRAENEQLRSQLAPPEPEEVPVQVVEAPPEPEPVPDSTPPEVEHPSTPEPKASKRKNVWF